MAACNHSLEIAKENVENGLGIEHPKTNGGGYS